MIENLHLEVLLAAGYALFLILVAIGLELFGRHSHRRSGQFRTGSFKYHGHLDVWECPCGHHLHRHDHDPQRGIVRYRAPAHTCNACIKKPDCTDSDHGREIIHTLGSWIDTQTGRFHRGMSLALLVLAAFILAVEMFRYRTGPELLLLCCLLAGVAILALRLIRRFLPVPGRRDSPSLLMEVEKSAKQ